MYTTSFLWSIARAFSRKLLAAAVHSRRPHLDIWGWALGGVVAPGHCEVLGGDGLDCVLSLVAQLSTYTRRSRAHTTTTKFDFLPTGMFERPLDHRKRLLRRARQQVESSRISDLASRSLASGDGISGPHSVV